MLKKRLKLKKELGNIEWGTDEAALRLEETKRKLKQVSADNKRGHSSLQRAGTEHSLSKWTRLGKRGGWPRLGGWVE